MTSYLMPYTAVSRFQYRFNPRWQSLSSWPWIDRPTLPSRITSMNAIMEDQIINPSDKSSHKPVRRLGKGPKVFLGSFPYEHNFQQWFWLLLHGHPRRRTTLLLLQFYNQVFINTSPSHIYENVYLKFQSHPNNFVCVYKSTDARNVIQGFWHVWRGRPNCDKNQLDNGLGRSRCGARCIFTSCVYIVSTAVVHQVPHNLDLPSPPWSLIITQVSPAS